MWGSPGGDPARYARPACSSSSRRPGWPTSRGALPRIARDDRVQPPGAGRIRRFGARRLPDDRKLRILEVGAGTGGTTAHVLPLLPADRTEYLFTDVSPLFTARAADTSARLRPCLAGSWTSSVIRPGKDSTARATMSSWRRTCCTPPRTSAGRWTTSAGYSRRAAC